MSDKREEKQFCKKPELIYVGKGYKLSEVIEELFTLRAKVAELEAEREWISVEDRLPDNAGDVLIFVLNGGHVGNLAKWSKCRVWGREGKVLSETPTHWKTFTSPQENSDD